jgi:serine/threonine protein kinase
MKPGTLLSGRYEIVGELGRGGMGIVYEARDTKLDWCKVAIKVVRSDRIPADTADWQRCARDLAAEGKRVARLRGNKHIVAVFDVEQHEGVPYVVMDLFRGSSLDQLLREQGGAVSRTELVRNVASGIGSALQFAHDRGILHCDVKPANILVDLVGQVQLTDFGIAKVTRDLLGGGSGGLTGYTPNYASPEQVAGREVGPASDQYSLAVVLYEMCTGRRLVVGEDDEAAALSVLRDVPVPANEVNPKVPPELGEALLRALSKRPQERFPSVSAFTLAVVQALEGGALTKRSTVVEEDVDRVATTVADAADDTTKPSPARRQPWLAWAVGAAVLVLVLLVRLVGGSPDQLPKDDSGKTPDRTETEPPPPPPIPSLAERLRKLLEDSPVKPLQKGSVAVLCFEQKSNASRQPSLPERDKTCRDLLEARLPDGLVSIPVAWPSEVDLWTSEVTQRASLDAFLEAYAKRAGAEYLLLGSVVSKTEGRDTAPPGSKFTNYLWEVRVELWLVRLADGKRLDAANSTVETCMSPDLITDLVQRCVAPVMRKLVAEAELLAARGESGTASGKAAEVEGAEQLDRSHATQQETSTGAARPAPATPESAKAAPESTEGERARREGAQNRNALGSPAPGGTVASGDSSASGVAAAVAPTTVPPPRAAERRISIQLPDDYPHDRTKFEQGLQPTLQRLGWQPAAAGAAASHVLGFRVREVTAGGKWGLFLVFAPSNQQPKEGLLVLSEMGTRTFTGKSPRLLAEQYFWKQLQLRVGERDQASLDGIAQVLQHLAAEAR